MSCHNRYPPSVWGDAAGLIFTDAPTPDPTAAPTTLSPTAEPTSEPTPERTTLPTF